MVKIGGQPVAQPTAKPQAPAHMVTGSKKVGYIEHVNGAELARAVTVFGETHKVVATQTGIKGDMFYAFVFYDEANK